MISTMPKSGQAPSSPNAMPGGLGAILQQPGGAPKGASSRSIQAILDTARKMSDMQLADVLSGKSLDVPQYVAMTEAMGRKSLRTAMQGAQAQQQARQPSVKDKLLAEEAVQQMANVDQMGNQVGYASGGLAELPAPNMESVDMAGGGIVAFQDNEDQPVRVGMPGTELTEEEKKALAANEYMQRVQGVRNVGNAFFTPRNYDPIAKAADLVSSIKNWGQNTDAANASWNASSKQRTGEAKLLTGEQTPKGKLVEAGLVSRDTPIKDVAKVAEANANKLTAADIEDANAGIGMRAYQNMLAGKGGAPKGDDGLAGLRKSQLMGTDTGTGTTPEKRANPFGELRADLPDYEKVKSQGLGEAMMAFSGALFGNPNLSMAMAQGLPTLAKVSGATRKEVADLKKDYNSQQLNLAKANELFEQGQEDKAFKYYKQSQDNAYHMATAMAQMAQATKPGAQAELFRLVQKENPGMSALDVISAMAGAKNEPKDDQAMRALYGKDPLRYTMPYDQWLKQNFPSYGIPQVAGGGTSGYDRGIYDVNGRKI